MEYFAKIITEDEEYEIHSTDKKEIYYIKVREIDGDIINMYHADQIEMQRIVGLCTQPMELHPA